MKFVKLNLKVIYYWLSLVERALVFDIECKQAVEKAKVVQCQWKTRDKVLIKLMRHLSVFDFTGHRKEWRALTELSSPFTAWRLKYNVGYKFQIGTASTNVILRGKLTG